MDVDIQDYRLLRYYISDNWKQNGEEIMTCNDNYIRGENKIKHERCPVGPAEFSSKDYLYIVSIDLSSHKFSGSIEKIEKLSRLSRLKQLDLSSNQLSGHIPESIGSLINLVGLDLSENQLSGHIPATIGRLSNLAVLNLSKNNLSDTIPSSIGSLFHLKALSFSNNQLSGPIPELIRNLLKLKLLDLSENQLNGPIPGLIGNLFKLEQLDLSHNQLSGPIPTSISQLINLTTKDIQCNIGLVNKIEYNLLVDAARQWKQGGKDIDPQQFIDLKIENKKIQYDDSGSVISIDLSTTQLSGPIPESIGSLSQLKKLLLSNNQLSGPIPSSVTKLNKLVEKDFQCNIGLVNEVEYNILTDIAKQWKQDGKGIDPKPFIDAKIIDKKIRYNDGGNVIYIDLHDNHLSGPILESIGRLSHLEQLDIADNKLSGHLPSSIGRLSHLERLSLQNNEMSGPIPNTVGSLAKLEILDLSCNLLDCSIPLSIDNLLLLKSINFCYNKLSGPIPSIGRLSHLRYINLSRNQLSGPIPTSIGSLGSLDKLDLSNNHLNGPIPTSMSKLRETYLQGNIGLINRDEYNILTDIAKQWKQDNSYIDPIQLIGRYVENYSITYNYSGNIVSIDLHDCRLSGPILESIGGLSHLKKLNLSSNQLMGPIPSSISKLTKLEEKDLQCNTDFVNKGEYYILLETVKMWKQGGKDISSKKFIDLKIENKKIQYDDSGSVTSIDLSTTQLSGSIPELIGNLPYLKELILSNNLLSGPIPEAIGSLLKLEYLDLDRNKLTDQIPPSVAGLSHLKRLDLRSNKLSGCIPPMIGSLSRLEKIDLSSNKELSGGLPSMSYNGCSISIADTGISRVGIKTRPLKYTHEKVYVVYHVVVGYVDLVLDLLAITALSSSDIPIMIANILFMVLNVSLGIWMSSNDVMAMLRTLLQVDQLYQGYKALTDGHETQEMIMSKKIDAVTRVMPSMILQMYGLLKSLSSPSNSDNSLIDRFLSPDQALLVSVASSIVSAGFTLASLAPNSGYNMFSKHFATHYVYYTAEVTNRLVILSVIFFTIGAYGFIVVGLDFLIRLVCGIILERESESSSSEWTVLNLILFAVQSFGSDHTINDNFTLYTGLFINTLEMFIFLIILNTKNTPPLEYARSYGASGALTAVACLTWLTRFVFYWTGVLDRAPEPELASKDAPMALKDASKLRVNRIETS